MEGKRTWLLIQALERASTSEDRALLDRVLDGGVEPEEVPEVRALMDRLGVLKDTRDAVIFHSDAAIGRLREVSESPAREALIGLVRSMQARLH